MNKLGVGVIVAAVVVAGLSIALATGVFSSASASKGTGDRTAENVVLAKAEASAPESRGAGMAAMDRAAKDNKYLFAFFWKTDDDQTSEMKKVFEDATKKLADRAQAVAVPVSDPAESGIVKKFGLDRAPMPLVLAIAPNGAITGGFPTKFEEKDLLNAFASPTTQKCMKALQDGKLVFVCVQSGSTKSNDAALQGVKEFKSDARFASATEIVMLDPSNSAEASFLSDLKIDPKTSVAVTAFLAPPGSAIAEFEGPTKKDDLVAVLLKASSACAGGSCGPGGCGPKK